jgi:hypothetical protein
MLAKAKLALSITFIVLASFMIATYDRQNMFIIQATEPNAIKLFYTVIWGSNFVHFCPSLAFEGKAGSLIKWTPLAGFNVIKLFFFIADDIDKAK